MKLGDKVSKAYRPDAQAFDEVKFVTVPRYKESGLSGDEWRISVNVQFWRNGRLMHEDYAGNDMEKAMAFASWKYSEACDNGKGYFAGEEDYCDQEGCSNTADLLYMKKKDWCSRCGESKVPYFPSTRQFCTKHGRRGDCGLDDSDSNYESVPKPVEEAGV